MSVLENLTMLDYALLYYRRGYTVLPLCNKEGTPSKMPQWAETGEILQTFATRPSEDHVISWWTRYPHANIGVLCGPLSGLISIDIDPAQASQTNPPRDLSVAYQILEVASPYQTLTGQPGGKHFHFANDPAFEWRGFSCNTKPTQGPLQKGPGVDIPWYVVVPPSFHPIRHVHYQANGTPLYMVDPAALPPLPKEFYQYADTQGQPPPPKEKWVTKMLMTDILEEGTRTNALMSLAGYLLEHHPPDITSAILKAWHDARLLPFKRTKNQSHYFIDKTVQGISQTRNRKKMTGPLQWGTMRADFPVEELFGEASAVSEFIRTLSLSTNTDPSMIAPCIFTAVSASMIGRYTIQVLDNWSIPPTFAIMCGSPSGVKKSEVYRNVLACMQPALQYQQDEWGTPKQISNRKFTYKRLEQVCQQLLKCKKEVFDPLTCEQEYKYEDAMNALRPYTFPYIRYIKTGTPEAIIKSLTTQPVLNIFHEEGKEFLQLLLGQYSDNTCESLFVQALDGSEINTLKLVRGHEAVDRAYMNILLFIQPELMMQYSSGMFGRKQVTLEEQGLLPRFLFSMPREKVDYGNLIDYTPVQNGIIQQVGKLLLEITKAPETAPIPFAARSLFTQDIIPHLVRHPQVIHFEKEAALHILAFEKEMQQESDYGRPLFKYARWTRRAHTLAAKVAVFLHQLGDPGTHRPVPYSLAAKGVWFIKTWAIPHMQIAYEHINCTPEIFDSLTIWKTFVERTAPGPQTFTFKSMMQELRWKSRETRFKKALTYMHELDYIKPVYKDKGLIHHEQAYECNPDVKL